MVRHRLAEQENSDFLPIFQFAKLAQYEQPLTCSCTETFPKSCFPKVITLSSLLQRGRRKKNIRKGNEITKEEQRSQKSKYTGSVPRRMGENGCILLTPGNPCPGTATGTLPASSTTVRNAAPSHPHITFSDEMFSQTTQERQKKMVCYETIQVLGHFLNGTCPLVEHLIKIIH